MTVHTKARIPAATDTVVTDRMGLDLDINQGSNEWLRLYCHFIEQARRLYHTYPRATGRVTPVDLPCFKAVSHKATLYCSGFPVAERVQADLSAPKPEAGVPRNRIQGGFYGPGLPEAAGVFQQ